jgi:hypothetical protein
MLAFWVVGAPVLVLIILIKNRDHLQDPFMKRYFLLLYQGLKRKAFYWEFINTIRKVLMPLFSVLLATFNPFYRAMVAIIILVGLFRVQQHLHPYKLEENNQIEMLAIITGMVTLFGALLFIDAVEDEEDVEGIQLFALVAIIFVNIYFILRWFHVFLYSFSSKNVVLTVSRKILGMALMRNKDEELSTQTRTVYSQPQTPAPEKKLVKKKKSDKEMRKKVTFRRKASKKKHRRAKHRKKQWENIVHENEEETKRELQVSSRRGDTQRDTHKEFVPEGELQNLEISDVFPPLGYDALHKKNNKGKKVGEVNLIFRVTIGCIW